jgi:hypothetical protein
MNHRSDSSVDLIEQGRNIEGKPRLESPAVSDKSCQVGNADWSDHFAYDVHAAMSAGQRGAGGQCNVVKHQLVSWFKSSTSFWRACVLDDGRHSGQRCQVGVTRSDSASNGT